MDMQEKVEIYDLLRDVTGQMKDGGCVYVGNPHIRLNKITDLFPEGTAERIQNGIVKDIAAHMIALRQAIREELNKDEAEQLGMEISDSQEEEDGEPEELHHLPKGDYRRHRTDAEEDDGK